MSTNLPTTYIEPTSCLHCAVNACLHCAYKAPKYIDPTICLHCAYNLYLHTLLSSQICQPPKMTIDMSTNLLSADLPIFCLHQQQSKIYSLICHQICQLCQLTTNLLIADLLFLFVNTISRVPSTHWYVYTAALKQIRLQATYNRNSALCCLSFINCLPLQTN